MSSREFLTTELNHAERHLARVRRLQTTMQDALTAQGLTEVAAYETLCQAKAYRQLQRDEAFYQQMWLRLHRHLVRLPQPLSRVDQELADLEQSLAKPQPYRKPFTPGPNQPCSCGSNLKYKRCCGNPLRSQSHAA